MPPRPRPCRAIGQRAVCRCAVFADACTLLPGRPQRPDTNIDYVTCMETANEFGDEDKESINHPSRLMGEATYVNQAFSQQARDCMLH